MTLGLSELITNLCTEQGLLVITFNDPSPPVHCCLSARLLSVIQDIGFRESHDPNRDNYRKRRVSHKLNTPQLLNRNDKGIRKKNSKTLFRRQPKPSHTHSNGKRHQRRNHYQQSNGERKQERIE